MKICIVGTGYVGLVTGAGFAEMGHRVICVDIEQAKIDRLKKGDLPIFEPGLDALVERNTAAGRLEFSANVAQGIAESNAVFICVGTPMRADGGANLHAVDAVAAEVARCAQREMVVVLKARCPSEPTLASVRSSPGLRIQFTSCRTPSS